MNPNFWQGRRVFLTGHTGFKGGWLALWLQSLGAIVLGYSLEPFAQPNLFELARVSEGMDSVIGDIRELNKLKQTIADFRPEIVFHLAAQALVRESYNNPVETYATNVMGTVNLLESVRQVDGVRAVVNVTSDKCYENRDLACGYRESDQLGGYDPYSSSKACAELVTTAYRHSFFNSANYLEHGVAISTARAGNVIGGGDWAIDRLVPDCLRAFEQGKSVKLRSPHAVRPWQNVLEPIWGYLLLAEKLMGTTAPDYACAWNFGPDVRANTTVYEVATITAKLWGNNASVEILSTEDQPYETKLLKLDITLAQTKLGWRPCWTVQQALKATVDWHQSWLKGQDMREYSLSQIALYQAAQSNLVNSI